MFEIFIFANVQNEMMASEILFPAHLKNICIQLSLTIPQLITYLLGKLRANWHYLNKLPHTSVYKKNRRNLSRL